MLFMRSFPFGLIGGILFLGCLSAGSDAVAKAQQTRDPGQGKIFFQQTCALCHADSSGPGNAVIVKQGPSLVGILGRVAASGANFNYTQAMRNSGLTWD